MKGKFIFGILLATTQLQASDFEANVIYGEDDRLDFFESSPADQQTARSTAALFRNSDIRIDGSTAKLNLSNYKETLSLCDGEKFSEQPIGAFCSGFLVSPDTMVTAGHCITSASACQGTSFVFDYLYDTQGKSLDTIPAANVYRCKSVTATEQENTAADFAVVKLDRPVSDRAPLDLSLSGTPAEGERISVIGYPVGLPVKVSAGAQVRNTNRVGHFVANLDTYGGNSGSAVINLATRKVEGILVRGENDFIWRGGCRVSQVCTDSGCRGEDVTLISEVLKYVK